jgi:hypothetical protein
MKVAFLTPPVPGHAYPMSSLARRIKAVGTMSLRLALLTRRLSFALRNCHSSPIARKSIQLVRYVRKGIR